MRAGWSTVVCAASGPSFAEWQAEEIAAARQADRCRVIAINDSWRRLPAADVLFALDGTWWDVHLSEIRAKPFAGELWTTSPRAAPGFVALLSKKGHRPLRGLNWLDFTTAPWQPGSDRIHTGRNSGHAAITLALMWGAKRIVLVGFDMKKGPGGEQHWFGPHPKPLCNEIPFEVCIGHFNALADAAARAGVEIVNASRDTALRCFRRAPLADAL